MNQTVKQKNKSIDLLMVLAFLIVARISCPALSNIPFFSMAFTFLYGVAFLGLFLITVRYITKAELTMLLLAALYTAYVLIRSVIADKGLFSTDAFNAYIIVFMTVICLWMRRQPIEKQAILIKLIFWALIFNYVYSIWVLTKDPGASRTAAATSVLEKSPYDVLNAVGSFDAVYGGISVVTILLCMLQDMEKGDKRKWFIGIILALAVVFIYMASYATALVLLVFTVALILGSRNKFFTGLVITGLLLVLICHEAIGQGIVSLSTRISANSTVQEKMRDFGSMLESFEATGTYGGNSGRAARMQWSLNAFISHPILGGFGRDGVKIGGHSEFLDLLGKYGILGFGLMTGFFVTLYRDIQKGLQQPKMQQCCKIVFFVWLITAVVNPALFSLQMMPIILMLPLSAAYKNTPKLR